MMDGNIFKGERDPNRIDVNDPVEVEYVHHQFPWLSHKKIREVIEKHGPDRDAVEAALERTGSSKANQV